MKVQQILILTTEEVSLMAVGVVSSVCYNPASTEGCGSSKMPEVNYGTIFQALADGWKLLGPPSKETDEEDDFYTWWLAKEADKDG